MNTNKAFFVYGTLRPGEGNYAWALDGRTTSEDTATLNGAIMYDYNGAFPFMATSTNPADQVTGTVIAVSDDNFAEVLRSLDRLEGYNQDRPQQGMYRREVMTVTTDTGKDVEAYVYICGHRMLAEVVKFPRIPSGDWFLRDPEPANSFTD